MPTDAKNPTLPNRTPSESPRETVYQDIREAASVGLTIVPDRHQRTQILAVVDALPVGEQRTAGAQIDEVRPTGTTHATIDGSACSCTNRRMRIGPEVLAH